jgi:hypothetical protein
MMVNTILELAEVDAELSARAARELAGVESLFEDYFTQMQGSGAYPEDRSAAELAAQVMLLNQGLRVASRQCVPRRALASKIETALSLLGLETTT